MFFHLWTRSKRLRVYGDQNGSAITEFSLVVPLLVFLIFAMVDLGAVMLNYMLFEQAAREGVRTAGRLPSISSIVSPHFSGSDAATIADISVCTATPSDPTCDHTFVHSRVRHILRTQNTWMVDLPEVDVTSVFDPLPGGCVVLSPEEDTVMVQMNGLYQGFMFNYNMNVTIRGPYLFQRTALSNC